MFLLSKIAYDKKELIKSIALEVCPSSLYHYTIFIKNALLLMPLEGFFKSNYFQNLKMF